MPKNYLQSIHHDGSAVFVRLPHRGEPRLGDEVTLRVRAHPQTPIRHLLVRLEPDGEQEFRELQPAEIQSAARWWETRLRLTMPLTRYRFLIFTPDGAWWYNARGLQQHTPTDAEDFRILADYAAPNWVRGSVFYQIFPDRFADGDPVNNLPTGTELYPGHRSVAPRWGEAPPPGGEGSVVFYGGDLQGVTQHLNHLQNLGVDALYLNPIFSAYSDHRYDVADYFNVDRTLGGNAALVELSRAAHARGLRYILDIVPNHCGARHPWFQQAQADPTAPTAEYFFFDQHPHRYAHWLWARALPKLNYASTALRQVMYAGEDSIFKHWLRPPYNADGWRVDVANMLGRRGAQQINLEVARGIRQAVKAVNPQAYLLAENFFDAAPQLQGDAWDANVNYSGFSFPLIYWLTRFRMAQFDTPRLIEAATPWATRALLETWRTFGAAIPWQIFIQQFNALGTHDTPRIRHLLNDEPALNQLAVTVQMTFPGVPNIYYGDEIGLSGEDARACMPWQPENWDNATLDLYRNLLALRRQSAFAQGGFQILAEEDNAFAYLRASETQQAIVVACRQPRPAAALPVWHGGLPDGLRLHEHFSRQTVTVTDGCLPLPAQPIGATVWLTAP